MQIRTPTAAEHADFVAFLDAGLRPEGAATRVDQDFPVALGLANLDGMLGCWEAGELVAGLAFLVRDLTSDRQDLPVAGIGSVTTRSDHRGQGLSARLQAAALDRLRARGVPLAVLWSDRPALYARRGFVAAGWEHHADLTRARLTGFLPSATRIRPFASADAAAVTALYAQHPLRTRRAEPDHAALYGMPGTRGLVLVDTAGTVHAYAFAGKGADFPHYVAEWGGPAPLVMAVLAEIVQQDLASSVLVPQGGEMLLDLLRRCGAEVAATTSGLWTVLAEGALPAAVQVTARTDPRAWLGEVTADGRVVPGPLRLAIWGLDSV